MKTAEALPRFRSEATYLISLALPIIVSQLGMMLLGVVDMLFLGHVSVLTLDAAALGNLWIIGTSVVAMGIVMGIGPIVSQAHGGAQGHTAGLALQSGVVVALITSIPVALSWLLTEELMTLVGQDKELSALAEEYVLAQLFSLPAFLIFHALREYLQGRGVVWPGVIAVVFANCVNPALNWVLVFGNLGFPAYGLYGSGLATGISRVVLTLVLVFWSVRRGLYAGAWIPWTRDCYSPRQLLCVLKLGLPVGLQFGLEVWAFQWATLLAGQLGKLELAAHTIVLNMASMAFMVPLGISLAAATRIGNLVGQGRRAFAQRSAWVALGLGTSVMLVSATVFSLLRELLPRLYTDDLAVATLAATALPIAACFQIFDGFQAVGGGILRGTGKPLPAAIINALAYYAFALPGARLLAFDFGFGLAGIWWGLCLGLATVSVCLFIWIARHGPAKSSQPA